MTGNDVVRKTGLGTPKAARIITVAMVIYLIAIGFLTYGYARVSNCLSDYANSSASNTSARAAAASEDRKLNDAEAKLNDQDRMALLNNDAALSRLLTVASDTKSSEAAKKAVVDNLLKVNTASAKTFLDNEKERGAIREQRADVEAKRKANPVPPPPSQTC